MAECTAGQKPYAINVFDGFTGDSPAEVCTAFGQYYSSLAGSAFVGEVAVDGRCMSVNSNMFDITHVCDATETPVDPVDVPVGTAVNCGAKCTIQIKPAEPSQEHITDMATLWGLFLVVLVVVFCAKQFLKFFESSPHE